MVHADLDRFAEFLVRVALAERRVQGGVQPAHDEFLVVGAARADQVAERLIGFPRQQLQARIGTVLDARQVQGAQFLDALVDHLDARLQLRRVEVGDGALGGRLGSGHGARLYRTAHQPGNKSHG
jgi:hypothetical protein